MLPFAAAHFSKELDFCFPVPKKTVEHFRAVFQSGVRFPAKTKLRGNCAFLPGPRRSTTASE